MRNRRSFFSGCVYFITSRTEEGLPFVPLRFMNILLWSALARAIRLYPVQLIAVTMEANHIHMVIRVIDPKAASQFVGYFKSESAHHLNRLLGRQGRSVWAERFDNPILLDFQKALDVFSYVMLNPVKDGLVDSISEYPGVSSYPYLRDGLSEVPVKLIPKSAVRPLRDPSQPVKEDEELVNFYCSDQFKGATLKLEPEGLRSAFPEFDRMNDSQVRQFLLSRLESAEIAFKEQRGNSASFGPYRLSRASILAPHTPPKNGRKMICLSSFEERRKEFIAQFRILCRQCKEVFERWKLGYTNIPFPPGMFAPPFPRLANMNPAILV